MLVLACLLGTKKDRKGIGGNRKISDVPPTGRDQPSVDYRRKRMFVCVGVRFSQNRVCFFVIEHFDSTNSVDIIEPNISTGCNIYNSLLAILCIDTLLRVVLEPVIHPCTEYVYISSPYNAHTPGSRTMGSGRITGFEVGVSREVSDLVSVWRWGLGLWQEVWAFRLDLLGRESA